MKYSNIKLAVLVAAAPLLLAVFMIVIHDSIGRTLNHQIVDIILLTSGLVLSGFFYLYLKHLAQKTERMLIAIESFRAYGHSEGIPLGRDDELGRLGSAVEQILQQERAHINALELSEGKLAALFAVVKEGIVIADEAGLMEDVNPSLCRMLGYEPEELIGQNVSMLMPMPYAQHHDQYMQNAIESDTFGYMDMYRDLKALHRDGRSIPVELSLDILRLSGRNLFAVTMRDVSGQREHERQLMKAKLKAEIANQAKSNFLSMMSHEIRTPLHGVMGALELLELEIPAPARELITVANKSANNLLHIVDSILDMAKAESGQMELEQTRFDLLTLLEESLLLYSGKARDKGVALEFVHMQALTTRVEGDAYRLRQMVNNLLSNAIKFTAAGTVSLSMNWHELDAERIEVVITVVDTGIGIAADQQQTVFEAFVQQDSSIRREYGGTGLGLSITKNLCQLMGGTITLRSEESQGSSFTLTIPLRKTEEALLAENGWLKDKEVVCVDSVDEFIRQYLQRHGAKLRRLTHQQLLSELNEQGRNVSLYIFDQADEQLLEQLNVCLQETASGEHVFLLICAKEEPWQIGLDERILIVRRPILSMSLDSVFRCLYDSEQTPDISVSTAGDRMKKILLVEDNPVNQMVAQAMLEKMGYQVVVAVNGQDGVTAMRAQPIDLVLMDLHMPVMDGYEATRQIRELLDRHVPILAMTADASVADREDCLAAGMDDHLPKPIKMDVLQQTVAHWLAFEG